MTKLYIAAYFALMMIPILSYSNITERESISTITAGTHSHQSSPVMEHSHYANSLCSTKIAKYINDCRPSYFALSHTESCPYKKS